MRGIDRAGAKEDKAEPEQAVQARLLGRWVRSATGTLLQGHIESLKSRYDARVPAASPRRRDEILAANPRSAAFR